MSECFPSLYFPTLETNTEEEEGIVEAQEKEDQRHLASQATS
jgi:hypothetical protein